MSIKKQFFGVNHRLNKSKAFEYVFQHADLIHHSSTFVFYLKFILPTAAQTQHSKLGLVIKKKHIKLATKRNQIKRLCREVFRKKVALLPPSHLIIASKPALKNALNQMIFQQLNQQFLMLSQHQSPSFQLTED